jgi:AcrR family transcriptional regulator
MAMAARDREAREAQIAEAAYALMAEKGFGGMSMLAVAKRAKASNETLYNWYGDKQGLFRMLIARNAGRVAERVEEVLARGTPDAAALEDVGAVLLEMLLSPEAVALNRAAAADASNALGQVLAEAGRGAVLPKIAGLFRSLQDASVIEGAPEGAAALWIDLLVGDLQIRCATGAMVAPDAGQIRARAKRAKDQLLVLSS